MDITIFPQHWSAILCIVIMIGAIVFGILKKMLMTYVLIVSNFIIFIISELYYSEVVYGIENGVQSFAGLGYRSIYLSIEYFPQNYTLITSMFIHGGFLHIFGNMLIFFFVGLPFEQRIGWKKFLTIYLLSGICGALTQSVLNLGSAVPLIGASGAIFGIMGAFAYSYPRDEVVMPIPVGIIMLIRKVKVIYAVILFAVLETVIVWLDVPDGTAHFAHFGGLISGAILAAILIGRNKTHTKAGKTVYYDSFSPQRTKKIDYSNLKELAITPELKQMVNKIENETVPQVKDIWLDHFLEKTICPKCKKRLNHFDGKLWCDNCGFRTNY